MSEEELFFSTSQDLTMDDDESCLGSSMVDEILTLPIALACFVLTILMGISAKRSLGGLQDHNTTLKYLLYGSVLFSFLEILVHIITYIVCIATDTIAFYISWIGPLCYGLLIMFRTHFVQTECEQTMDRGIPSLISSHSFRCILATLIVRLNFTFQKSYARFISTLCELYQYFSY